MNGPLLGERLCGNGSPCAITLSLVTSQPTRAGRRRARHIILIETKQCTVRATKLAPLTAPCDASLPFQILLVLIFSRVPRIAANAIPHVLRNQQGARSFSHLLPNSMSRHAQKCRRALPHLTRRSRLLSIPEVSGLYRCPSAPCSRESVRHYVGMIGCYKKYLVLRLLQQSLTPHAL